MAEADDLDGLGSGTALARAVALKKKVRDGGVIIGAWASFAEPAICEILGGIGFDFIMFDTEHTAWDLHDLQNQIMALRGTPTVPFARVPWNDHVHIKRALDLGVEGIMAPMVRTVEECRALVSACRYPPVGTRGFGPRRASNYYQDMKAYETRANDAIFVMPQIEDVATVDVIDEFLDVPGIDGVAIGPNDMSGTAGVFRNPKHPKIVAAIDTICEHAKARNIPVFMGVDTPASEQRGLISKGVRILTVTQDVRLIAAGAREALDATLDALKG